MSEIKNMSLNGFFKNKAKQVDDVRVVVSERFLDEEGKPLEWVLHPLSTKAVQEINKKNTVTKLVNGKRVEETNNENLEADLLEKAVLFPRLNDAELQDSYGVTNVNDLLSTMLYPGETQTLREALEDVMSGKANTVSELKN